MGAILGAWFLTPRLHIRCLMSGFAPCLGFLSYLWIRCWVELAGTGFVRWRLELYGRGGGVLIPLLVRGGGVGEFAPYLDCQEVALIPVPFDLCGRCSGRSIFDCILGGVDVGISAVLINDQVLLRVWDGKPGCDDFSAVLLSDQGGVLAPVRA